MGIGMKFDEGRIFRVRRFETTVPVKILKFSLQIKMFAFCFILLEFWFLQSSKSATIYKIIPARMITRDYRNKLKLLLTCDPM